MQNHTAALFSAVKAMRACALDPHAMEILEIFAERVSIITADLEKAQAKPVAFGLVDGNDVRCGGPHYSEVDAKAHCDYLYIAIGGRKKQPITVVPLYRAQPPAIPVSMPSWFEGDIEGILERHFDQERTYAKTAQELWEVIRERLEATEPKAVVASQSKDAEDARRYRFWRQHYGARFVYHLEDGRLILKPWDPAVERNLHNYEPKVDAAIDAAIAAEEKANG